LSVKYKGRHDTSGSDGQRIGDHRIRSGREHKNGSSQDAKYAAGRQGVSNQHEISCKVPGHQKIKLTAS